MVRLNGQVFRPTDQNAKKYTYSVKEVDDKGELITKEWMVILLAK